MSLKVWMPLTEDSRNNGLLQLGSPSYNGFSKVSGGKIGDASHKGCAIYHFQNEVFGNKWTLALWVKSSGWGQYNDILICKNNSTSDNDSQFYFSIIGGILLNIGINGPSGTGSYSYTFNTNQWYHVAATYDGNNYALYINGLQVKTGTCTTAFLSGKYNFGVCCRSTNANGTSQTGVNNVSANDVRVYDEALSPKEIELISRGLVLHYPLNRDGFGQNNLLSRYVSPGGQAPGATATAGRTNYYGDYGIIIPATENADTYFRLFLKEQLVQNETYTISCNVSGLLNGSMYRFPLFAQGNTSMGLLELNHNGLCSLTFTMTYSTQSAATIGNETVYICFMDDNGRTLATGQGPITVTNFKIEKGSVATPWIPASTDALYSSLGLNSNIIYDTSGYGNNGTKNGSFSYVSNTPRMCMSTEFNGTDNAIIIPFNNILGTSQRDYTISVWIYKTSIGSKSYQTILGGPSGFELEARNAAGTDPVFVGWNWGKPTAPYEFNKWTLFTFVHTTTDCKIYVNGQYVSTGSSKSNPSGNYYIGAWSSATGQNYQGLMSDFRIYCTALTAEQILELYNTSASLANDGTLLSYEFVEGGA